MGWAKICTCSADDVLYPTSFVMDLPWILIPIAEEIILKSSHGQGGNFQLTWRGQRIQYLHLPIKFIFVSRVNNLCYSLSWKMRQSGRLSSCRPCTGKQHPKERNLTYQTFQISRVSKHAEERKKKKKGWLFFFFFKRELSAWSSAFYLFQGDGFNPRSLHISYALTPNAVLPLLRRCGIWAQKATESRWTRWGRGV